MPGIARKTAFVAGFVAIMSAGTAVLAEPIVAKADAKAAETRLGWAKRHIELVCRPLEAKQLFDRATRCYNDVARLVGDTAQPLPATATTTRKVVRTAAVPHRPVAQRQVVQRVVPVRRVAARPVAIASNESFFAPEPVVERVPAGRCSGISCLQRYTLLGVGF